MITSSVIVSLLQSTQFVQRELSTRKRKQTDLLLHIKARDCKSALKQRDASKKFVDSKRTVADLRVTENSESHVQVSVPRCPGKKGI